MKRLFKRSLSSKETVALINAFRKLKVFITVLGLLGILWQYVPMRLIEAHFFSEDGNVPEFTYMVNDSADGMNYPTTMDPNFDPSEVEIITEVIEERTDSSKTFRKADGTYEVALYDEVIHYIENGTFVDINNTFTNNGLEHENTDNIFKIKFPNKLDDNKQIKLTLEDYQIDWYVLNIDSSDIYYENQDITPNNMRELPNISDSIMYYNIQNGVDIEYVLNGTEIKENIILNEYIQDFSLSFEYKLKDLSLVEDVNGEVYFENDQGERVFDFKELYMYDSEFNISYDVDIEIIETGNRTYTVTIIPNDEWLQNAMYPVVVDPSLEVTDSNSTINDMHTFYSDTQSPGRSLTSTFMNVGRYGDYEYRSYIELPTNITFNDSVITYAYLKLKPDSINCLYMTTLDCNIVVREVDSIHSFTSIQPNSDLDYYVTDNVLDYDIIKYDESTSYSDYFDISKTYQGWVNEGR